MVSDSLTLEDRLHIVETVAGFREAIFHDTTRLDGCTVGEVLGVGSAYRELIRRDMRYHVSEPTSECVPKVGLRRQGLRVILRRIVGGGEYAVVDAEFIGGSYMHSERYTLRRRRGTGRASDWIAVDVTIFDLMMI